MKFLTHCALVLLIVYKIHRKYSKFSINTSNFGPVSEGGGITPLPDYINQVITGLLLGDGTLIKKYVGGGTYLKYAQSTIHSEYLQFLFDMFKKFGVILMDKPYFGTSIVKGKSHNYFSFTTRSLSIWNTFYNMWYSPLRGQV